MKEKLYQYLQALVNKSEHYTKFIDKSELQAIRAAYLGIGLVVSVVLGVTVGAVASNFELACLTSTASLCVFAPVAIIVASREIRERIIIYIGQENANYLQFLQDRFEEEQREIRNLGASKKVTDRLLLEALKKHRLKIDDFYKSRGLQPRLE